MQRVSQSFIARNYLVIRTLDVVMEGLSGPNDCQKLYFIGQLVAF